MIRNKLAVLLAERQLKITRVSNDTHISRTTLTALAQNDSRMIQNDTINTLCRYLKITPSDFFEYVPIDLLIYIEFNKTKYDKKIDNLDSYTITAYLNFDTDYGKEVIEYLGGFDVIPGNNLDGKDLISGYIEPSSQTDVDKISKLLADVSQGFITDIEKQLYESIGNAMIANKVLPIEEINNHNLFNESNIKINLFSKRLV